MRRPRGGSSTTAVLWLMILLVFLPIAAGHMAARYVHPEPAQEQQATRAN
ncbi:hypothetical protein [uncultured Enterovirga sp.]